MKILVIDGQGGKLGRKLLEDIRDGNNNLTELHYIQDDPETPEDESKANGVTWSSNPKRQNFF